MLQEQRREPGQIDAIEQSGWHPSASGFKHAKPFQELHSLPLGIGSQPGLRLQPSLLLKKPALAIAQSATPVQQLRQ